MNDTMSESDVAIGDGQGPEKAGVFALEIVDSHDYGFAGIMIKQKE